MKKPIKKATVLFLSALMLTGFAACGKAKPETATSNLASTANAVSENTEAKEIDGKKLAVDFKEVGLVKVGEHTLYPEDLFEGRDRDRKNKEHMIEQLAQADKDLHDDIYVYGIGESEVRGEFRFFGKMMKDGVIWDSADMTCWYDEEKGSFWDIDSRFRRADFNKSGLLDAKDFFAKVYANASNSPKCMKSGKGTITGTYLLACDGNGRLFYRFTVNKYSTVDVDAKTGEIISEHYWDGIYT